jgi:hypothetical protein
MVDLWSSGVSLVVIHFLPFYLIVGLSDDHNLLHNLCSIMLVCIMFYFMWSSVSCSYQRLNV